MMSDSHGKSDRHHEPDDDDRFAEQLDRYHRVLSSGSDLEFEKADSAIDRAVRQRVVRSKPVLELLNELLVRPELVSGPPRRERGASVAAQATDAETGDRTLDRTVPTGTEPKSMVPNLQHLGRFQIVREIGRGGNGIVVLANDTELNRQVAIKIPRIESALSTEAKIRFKREARAAAALSHPGIVAIHEVGHEQGVDFIVSQFVDGASLAEWADDRLLAPRVCAQIAVKLADAIQHAHQRGVLHRDLKPSNVIVERGTDNETDIADRCRIADFGLAAIRLENPGSADWTQSGSLIGTPAYMAPEQAGSRRDGIGPATDVYGLGIILYQLLTRQPPFAGADLLELVAQVRKVDPVAPIRINHEVHKDLNAVVMKCLEKQPSKRYSSAAELRTDLERFLNHEPVLARRSTPWSRGFKWIRRNTAAAGLLLVLALAVAGTSTALVRALNAEADARKSESDARIESETAREVSRFLENMFEIPDLVGRLPGEPGGRKMTAEEFLMRGAETIRHELNDQPVVKARLMTKIGAVLGSLELFDQAEELLDASLKLSQEQLPADHPDVANSHRQLGGVLRRLERIDEAETHLRRAIAIYELNSKSNFKPLAGAYNTLGVLLRPGDPLASRDAYCRARDLMEQYQPDFEMNWAINANIAVQDFLAGRYEQARDAFLKAIQFAERTCGAGDVRVATLKGNLSRVYLQLGQVLQARDLRLSDIEITERELGADDTRVGVGLLGLAVINQRLGRLDEALENGNRALAILRARLPADHSHIRAALNSNAVTLMRQNRYKEALAAMDEIDGSMALLHGQTAKAEGLRHQILRAEIERMADQHESALERINHVLADSLLDQQTGTGIDARICLAFVLAEMGDSRAEDAFRNAKEFAESASGLPPSELRYQEAKFQAILGKSGKAIDSLNEAIESGFSDARLLTDPELRLIHDSPDYQAAAAAIKFDLALTD